MAYNYYGKSGFIKTGEAITVLPSGLIQKKITVVRRSVKGESLVLTQSEADGQLGDGFSAYPLPSANKQNNGFSQFDIVGYSQGSGIGINYKYRRPLSFIIEDQYNPRSYDILIDVGVASTVVKTAGTQSTTTNPNGDSVNVIGIQPPNEYQGKLDAYNLDGSVFSLTNTEVYVSETIRTTTIVKYVPVTILESVSSTYYGDFTEYITTSSLKIERQIISQTSVLI
jgi:hypothetical protein